MSLGSTSSGAWATISVTLPRNRTTPRRAPVSALISNAPIRTSCALPQSARESSRSTKMQFVPSLRRSFNSPFPLANRVSQVHRKASELPTPGSDELQGCLAGSDPSAIETTWVSKLSQNSKTQSNSKCGRNRSCQVQHVCDPRVDPAHSAITGTWEEACDAWLFSDS